MNERRNSKLSNLKRRRSPTGRGSRHYEVRVRTTAALGILVVWSGTTLYDVFSKAYDPPEGVNTVALAAATYLFGSAFIKENK